MRLQERGCEDRVGSGGATGAASGAVVRAADGGGLEDGFSWLDVDVDWMVEDLESWRLEISEVETREIETLALCEGGG